MNRLRSLLYFIAFALGSYLLVGCNTSGCLENRSAIPLAGFYSSSTGTKISIDSLVITGIGAADDVPLYDGNTAISDAYLPMRATAESTAWQLEYHLNAIIDETIVYFTRCDTISFGYTTSPYFASVECGVIYKYDINHMSYTTNLIDSVVITDSLITNLDTERIKIYFRTRQPENDTD